MEKRNTYEKYAIFQTGGKQYQAVEGKTIAIEKVDGEPGIELTFDQVLMRKEGKNDIKIGQPYLETPITAKIVKHIRAPKVIVFKFKRRKKMRKKKGHRQPQTVIRVTAV